MFALSKIKQMTLRTKGSVIKQSLLRRVRREISHRKYGSIMIIKFSRPPFSTCTSKLPYNKSMHSLEHELKLRQLKRNLLKKRSLSRHALPTIAQFYVQKHRQAIIRLAGAGISIRCLVSKLMSVLFQIN